MKWGPRSMAPSPVCGHAVVNRRKEETMNTHAGTLICGVDEVAHGADAADIGRALAARLGLRLVLVSVLDGVPEGTHESLSARQRQAGAERALDLIARELGDGIERRVVLG